MRDLHEAAHPCGRVLVRRATATVVAVGLLLAASAGLVAPAGGQTVDSPVASAAASTEAYPLVMPVTGKVESLIGGGCPSRRVHSGIDISSPLGTGAEIRAAYPGFATSYDRGDGYGLTVDVVHAFPGGTYLTRYAHLSAAAVPPAGQWVQQGDVVGMMGSTGNAEIVHLHFELRRGDDSVVDLNPAFAPCRREVTSGDPITIEVPGLVPVWEQGLLGVDPGFLVNP